MTVTRGGPSTSPPASYTTPWDSTNRIGVRQLRDSFAQPLMVDLTPLASSVQRATDRVHGQARRQSSAHSCFSQLWDNAPTPGKSTARMSYVERFWNVF